MCAIVFCAVGAPAHDSTISRYRVTELPIPASLKEGCLNDYFSGATVLRINDLGIVNATSVCYSAVDPATGVLLYKSQAFIAAPWFGAVELPQASPGTSHSGSINNRGQIFGYEGPETGGLYAARWTLAGGRERIFFDPACDTIQFQGAVDGNGRYTVGWGLRGDPNLPPPADQLCIKTRWLIRNAAGVETSGPLGGSPSAINAHDVAAGTMDRSAVKFHVPTGQLTVLRPADSAHSAEATDINDLGEVAGRISQNEYPDISNQCDPGVAVRWERNGRERALPHLPGAVSSRAFGVGYNGETVGDSGAGVYCNFPDSSHERAVLWKAGRAYDLNTLIPRGAGVTLTYAYSVNRRGQITAGGYLNDEPMTLCPTLEVDPETGMVMTVPCHNQRMFVLTPAGR